jgi:hypothetical protein
LDEISSQQIDEKGALQSLPTLKPSSIQLNLISCGQKMKNNSKQALIMKESSSKSLSASTKMRNFHKALSTSQ